MFSYQEAEKLRKACELALNQAGHRNKNKKTGKRKQRSDKSLVEWQKISEKDAKKLGYSNYSEWKERKGLPDNFEEEYND